MSSETRIPPEFLRRWLDEACEELGLESSDIPVAELLDMARDVAHGVARPAAPLTTFLLGMAVGRELDADMTKSYMARLSHRAADYRQARDW